MIYDGRDDRGGGERLGGCRRVCAIVLVSIALTFAVAGCASLYAERNWLPPRGERDQSDFQAARAACQRMSGSAREEPVSVNDRVSGGPGPVSRAGAEGWSAERHFKRCMEAAGWVWNH